MYYLSYNIMKRLFGIIIFLLIGIHVFAQNVSFQASAKNLVAQGENFYLQYSINQKGSNFKLSDLGDFQILSGPSQAMSSSSRNINGKITQNYSFTYTYIIKAPQKEGKYTISPAKITVEGKEYTSNPLTIQVAQNNQTQNQTQPSNTNTRNISNTSAETKNFVHLSVNKTNAYLGEPIYGTFKLYIANKNLAGFQDIQFPEYKGFWAEDVNNPTQIHLQTENYNGQRYYTAELKSIVLYPQRTGELEISQGTYDIIMQERVSGGGGSNSPFDAFFSRYENVPYSLKSNAVKIHVKPLPATKPLSFNGAVGKFNLSSKISHDSIDVNEAFTIKISMQGTGNLNLVNAPKLNLPNEFEVYDPEVNKRLTQTANGSNGSISWTYTIIPRYPDNYTLNPIEISWFNPSTESYEQYSCQKQHIFVRRTADFKENETVKRGLNGSDINVLSEDIRFIKDIPQKPKENFVGKTSFWLAYILPLLGFFIIIFARRKQIKERANKAKIRNKKANKTAQKRLKASKKLIHTNSNEFYNEISKALWGYVGDKLNFDTANISRESISAELRERNVPENLINEFLNIIDVCEYAHFAPSSKDNNPQNIYQNTANLITNLEQNM